MLAQEIEKRLTFSDLEYRAVYSQPHSHAISFDVYRSELDEEEHYISGSVKWDGCSNFYFPALEECQDHRCSRQGLLSLGELLATIWDDCASLLKEQKIWIE